MQRYWIWYAMLTELSTHQKLDLLERFSTPEEIYRAEVLPDGTRLNKDLQRALMVQQVCKRKNIGILNICDGRYPVRLRNIADPPLVLYCKGILPQWELQPAIGVVGTRRATPYGRDMAKELSAQIAQCGGLVISGAASGIDACALNGALETGATAVAVLGCGVDIVYPTTNRRLFMELEAKGCILSEYPPGTGPKPWHFPARNRIISGLCNGVLVVEAPQKSGALITARNAANQGRDLFVVPGNIDMETCQGSNALLRDGATAVFSGWDVLCDYREQYPKVVRPQQSKIPVAKKKQAEPDKKDIDIPVPKPYSVIENTKDELTEQEQKLLSCVDRTPMPMDAVVAAAHIPVQEALRLLTKLALSGHVVNHPGKLISRK